MSPSMENFYYFILTLLMCNISNVCNICNIANAQINPQTAETTTLQAPLETFESSQTSSPLLPTLPETTISTPSITPRESSGNITILPTTPDKFVGTSTNDANKNVIDYSNEILYGMNFVQTEKSLGNETEATSFLAKHHDHDELFNYLHELNEKYPEVTRLYDIGSSSKGRKLYVLEITENPGKHELLKPEFKYVANIHGNEVVGREMLLHLARLILENYRAAGEEADSIKPSPAKFAKKLLESTRIHILPTMNPDGYANSRVACKFEPSKKGRVNANNVDLNRNFPDPIYKNQVDAGTQPEVRAVIDWSKSYPFVLSANIHGGAIVASYPYDGLKNKSKESGTYSSTPDDDLFRHLASVYARNHETMASGKKCYDECVNYHDEIFKYGIVNGAEWYPLYGGMQDWVYENTNCLEITLEIGCNQYPEAASLPQYWNYNKLALLNYIKQVHRGIKGTVKDSKTGLLLSGVTVHVLGRHHNVTSTRYGDYFRILLPGNYNILFVHEDYEEETIFVNVDNTMPIIIDIRLLPKSSDIIGEPSKQGTQGPVETSEHSLVVATLVMTIIIALILIAMGGAHVIQKRRFARTQSMSLEMQPTRSGSSNNPHLSP